MNTEIEDKIRDYLVSKEVYPYSVLFLHNPRLLKISVYLESDLQEILQIFKADEICDNYGYEIFPDTILIFGSLLTNFLRDVGCEEMH